MLQKLATLLSFFPDIEVWKAEKIHKCMSELFNDCTLSYEDIDDFKTQRQALNYLLNLPKVEQRSKEWFLLRETRLTASDLAQAMNKGKFGNRSDLLMKKAFPSSKPLDMVPPLKWGVMFEEMGMRCYQQVKNNVKIHEFGLILHDTIDCFGASPDGITETCIMVEMKCPYSRKFNGEIPEQYIIQIQGQLATCKLKECDYVECYMIVYDHISEYEMMIKETDKHGIILEYTKDGNYVYEYSPPNKTASECIEWGHETFRQLKQNTSLSFVKMTPWKLNHMFIKRVPFDKDLWDKCVPKIYEFWNDTMSLREKGPPNTPITQKTNKNTFTLKNVKPKQKFVFIHDSDDES